MREPHWELLDDLLDAVGCGLLVVDGSDDRVVHASPRAERLLDRPAATMVGTPLASLLQARAEANPPVTRDWPLRWSSSAMRSLRGDGSATDGVHGYIVLADETASREKDEELGFLRRAVDRLDSLALAEHAAAAVSHDLNNVLQSVVGLTQLALEDPSRETLAALNETASHASRLSRLLLQTGRPRPDGSPDCDPAAVLQRIEPVLECLLRRRLRLEIDAAGQIAVPRPALERIVINLAANARDATVAGGTVAIRTRADRDAIVIEVQDDGTGMDPETLLRARDLAFTTKPDGTGLGLALVQRIVRRYEGSFDLQSELGRGTRAIVRLPRALS